MNIRLRDWFDAGVTVSIAQAPARLDVMGGIADYSGSLVLEATLGCCARAYVARSRAPHIRVVTLGIEDPTIEPESIMPLDAFYLDGELIDYCMARSYFARNSSTHWAAYLAGCVHVLLAERRSPPLDRGVTIVLESNVPLGAGVSSSAAIEVATMAALTDVLGIPLEDLELAALCQKVENHVVGAPCGIMDQVTCALGESGKLLALRCQPHDLIGNYSLPQGVQVIGINSNVRHRVSGQAYTRARVGAFMGLRIIQELIGEERVRDYLCNITPEYYESALCESLPVTLTGREFMERYGSTPDPVTTVTPEVTYAVRSCTEHPIYENDRVHRYLQYLQAATGEARRQQLVAAGSLMYASHDSYGDRCGLGCVETDLLVQLVRQRGPERGFYGAKITGGGGGGTVAILCEEGVETEIQAIAEAYERETGLLPQVFTGSLPGALRGGVTREVA